MRGSGAPRSFVGGKYYGGGAALPYRAGTRSPLGVVPFLLPAAALTLIFPGLWLYSAYGYAYSNPYYYRNGTRGVDDDDDDNDLVDRRRSIVVRQAPETNPSSANGTVQVLPILCLCQEYSVCGCDDNSDSEFLRALLPNDTATTQLDESLVRISDVNNTRTIVINGTLANGTTAPGGTEEEEQVEVTGAAGSLRRTVLESMGLWAVVFLVGWTVWSV